LFRYNRSKIRIFGVKRWDFLRGGIIYGISVKEILVSYKLDKKATRYSAVISFQDLEKRILETIIIGDEKGRGDCNI
jgi:hypothetical protein